MIGVLTTRRARVLLCAVALALWAVLPAQVAWAGPGQGGGQGERADHAGQQGSPEQARPGERRGELVAEPSTTTDPEPAGRAARSEEARGRGSDTPRRDGGHRRDDTDRGNGRDTRNAHGRADHDVARDVRRDRGADQDTGQGAGTSREDGRIAPNRGSVKVRTSSEIHPPRHEPHVGCEFYVHFHGFDQDDARAFRLLAWAPTGNGEVLYEGTTALAAARGDDSSAVYGPIRVAQLDGIEDLEPHDQQGWHLRLEVDGPKHKMLWVACDQLPGDRDAEDRRTGATDDAPSGIGGGLSADDAAVRSLLLEEERRTTAAGERSRTEVRAVTRQRPEESVGGGGAAGEAEVAAAGRDAGDGALPVTGVHLAWLLALAGAFVAVGGRLAVSGRDPGTGTVE